VIELRRQRRPIVAAEADGPDAGDRLASIVAQAVGLGLVRNNPNADEATDPWALPAGKAVRS